MALQDCINEALAKGLINEETARATRQEFAARLKKAKQSAPDEVAADALARGELAASLTAKAIELKRRAALQQKALLMVNERLTGFRNVKGEADVFKAAEGLLSHYGYRGGSSVRGRYEAILSLAHGKLADMMEEFHRTLAIGQRPNRPLLEDIVRALKGENVADSKAKEYAKILGQVMEDLRQRFNNAGGAIAKLDGWGLPQTHDVNKIKQLGRQAWKQAITPLLDADKMLDPLTGKPVGAGGLDGALDHVYETIVSQGWAHKLPDQVAHGKGSVASQRQDARFLTFKDANSWLRYNESYGKGDVLQSIFNHINAMAKDVATLEILGPNPEAMMTYLKNIVAHEYGKLAAGQPSLARMGKGYRSQQSAARRGQNILDALYGFLRGQPQEVAGFAQAFSDVRNVMGASLLGSASILAATTDPFIARAARDLAGLPATTDMMHFMKNLQGQKRKEIIRSGIIWDDYLFMAREEARMMGALSGRDWSKNLVDISVTLSGLKPMTTARKVTEARAWQAGLADEAGKSFHQLNDRLRHTLEGFGIGADDWHVMRRGVDENGFLTSIEIDRATGRRDVAEKLSELIASWTERAVPAGTLNARARVVGKAERGTPWGEIAHSFMQFKSFGFSFTSLQFEAMHQILAREGKGKFGSYFAALVIPLTLGGAVSMQLKNLAAGKDLEDVRKADFWARAAVAGGGFGILGDFLAAGTNCFGGGVVETLIGPAPAFIGDVAQVGFAAAGQLAGSKRNTGREAIKLMQRYTPILSSHWATRGAYRHLILDQLQFLVDPQAHQTFKTQMSRAKKEGPDYWWRLGETLPKRAPHLF